MWGRTKNACRLLSRANPRRSVPFDGFGTHRIFWKTFRIACPRASCSMRLPPRARKPGNDTWQARVLLGGFELPVLFAMFFVFKFLFFYSGFLCKTGVGSSSPLPECFQKIEKEFLQFDPRLSFPFRVKLRIALSRSSRWQSAA